MKATAIHWRNGSWAAFGLLAVCLAGAPAAAQVEVGTVVAARGTVELQRGRSQTWSPAPVGQSVLVGDVLRTSERGGAKILFGDDAVLDIGSAAQLEIGKYTVDAAATEPRSLLRLSRGKLHIRLSEFYATARLRYEMETPTAVVRVPPGGEAIVVVDPSAAHSDVFVREGAAQVQGILGVIGPPVDVAPAQVTRVQQGTFPAPPREPSAEETAAAAEGLEIVGTGSSDGLDVGNPVVAARLLRQEDRPEAVAAGPAAGAPSYLNPDTPGETLQERLSPDLRTNTQPIPEFRAAPPGVQPTGTVDVDL